MNVELSLYDPALSYTGQKQFDCEHAVISSFVHNSLKPQVKKSLSVAYVLTDADQANRFVGFYTIAQHMIDVSLLSSMQLGSLPRKIPCSRLVMLGIDKRYKGQKLGSMLMKHALTVTRSVAKQIGGFGMYLDADPLAVDFYQKLGFVLLEGDRTPEPSSMFLPLNSDWLNVAGFVKGRNPPVAKVLPAHTAIKFASALPRWSASWRESRQSGTEAARNVKIVIE